ncbi:MAG: SusF/SusE family outer membrane protein [Paludibacteraceae bacterium]|nr:SusF/SusE family outer membrane protein [Paludibacteraceae bacterium]
MKKLGLFMCALAAVGMMFTACKKNDNKGGFNPEDIMPDGMYVVGPATGINALTDANAINLLTAQGVNEKLMDQDKKTWEEAHRAGMYEKYLFLNANQDFSLVLLDGTDETIYGGDLQEATLVADKGDVAGYWCALEIGKKMQVPVTGFYHVIMDVNKEGDLDAAGGAQIIVAPVAWGISGGCNGWGFDKAELVADPASQTATWTVTNAKFMANQEFKFKDEMGWKIWLDGETQQVSANTNLGKDMRQGGDNIVVAENGIYTVTLTFKLGKGDFVNSYAFNLTKTADVEVADYSNSELVVVGDAVNSDTPDFDGNNGGWSWGNIISLGLPEKNGNLYTWKKTVSLVAGGCKIRSIKTTDDPYYEAGANGGNDNITITEAGDYVITATIDAATNTKTVKVEGGTPAEPIMMTVKAKLPADWTNTPTAWVWPTGGDGSAAALTQQGDWWVYTTPEPVAELNIIFRNGDGWDNGQTVDISLRAELICYQIMEGEGNRNVTQIDCE